MSKFDYRKLSTKERQALIGELLDTLHEAKNRNVLGKFLLQLLTPSEAVMLARRWQVAQLLAAGQSYYRISRELKVGISTIESVDRWLSEAIGDYRQQLEKQREQEKTKRLRRGRPTVLPNTVPFLLLNLLAEGALQVWAAEIRLEEKRVGKNKTKRKHRS